MVHDTIKFEMTLDEAKINFLDSEARKVGNKIQADIYRKPTDANSFSGKGQLPLISPKKKCILFTNA